MIFNLSETNSGGGEWVDVSNKVHLDYSSANVAEASVLLAVANASNVVIAVYLQAVDDYVRADLYVDNDIVPIQEYAQMALMVEDGSLVNSSSVYGTDSQGFLIDIYEPSRVTAVIAYQY